MKNDFAERFFPEVFRAFANGPLSLCAERFGGIESVNKLDIRMFGEKPYPSMYAIEIFSHDGILQNRPFQAPAIAFENRRDSGALFRFCPEYPEIHPSGFKSSAYDLRLSRDSFCTRLKDHVPGIFAMMISKHHYFWKQGKCYSNQNQYANYAKSWLPDELRGPEFNSNWPFPENGMTVNKIPPVFSLEEKSFTYEIRLQFADHAKKLFAVTVCSLPLEFIETTHQWIFTAHHSGSKDILVSTGFGDTRNEALQAARISMKNDHACWLADTNLNRFPMMPLIRIEGLPDTEWFIRKFPYYQSAAIVADTPRECCNRASQNNYGYFAMWDHIFPTRDYLIMGLPEWTKRSLRHIITYPHVDTAVSTAMQTIPAANEYLAFTGDLDFIKEMMPYFRRFYEFASSFAHPETGLIKNTMATAVDVPDELGCHGLFYDAGVNGWWYDFCRGLQNMCISLGDENLAEKTGKQADRIQKHYLEVFFDPSEGFLVGDVPEEKGLDYIPLHIYTATLALEYAHGSALMRKVIDSLADFQVRRLHSPLGHTEVPMDSPVPCINLKSVHMNQHLGHECRCARLGGHTEEAYHVMKNYLGFCGQYENAIETFNYCHCKSDEILRADWQTFSATGAMQGILHGLAGLDWHRGGLYFIPAADDHEIKVGPLLFQGSVYYFHCTGAGDFVKSMSINGREIAGTLQLPDEIQKPPENKNWVVVRTHTAPDRPILLSAVDLRVSGLNSNPGHLKFSVVNDAFSTVDIFSVEIIEIFIDKEQIYPEKQPGNVWSVSKRFRKGMTVTIGFTSLKNR